MTHPFHAVLVVAAVAACATFGPSQHVGADRNDEQVIDYRLRVECACEWIASLPDDIVEGAGRTTLQLPDNPFVCASVSKAQTAGCCAPACCPTASGPTRT